MWKSQSLGETWIAWAQAWPKLEHEEHLKENRKKEHKFQIIWHKQCMCRLFMIISWPSLYIKLANLSMNSIKLNLNFALNSLKSKDSCFITKLVPTFHSKFLDSKIKNKKMVHVYVQDVLEFMKIKTTLGVRFCCWFPIGNAMVSEVQCFLFVPC